MNDEFQFSKIGLIKLLRVMTDIGLKEAKDVVDFVLDIGNKAGENDEIIVAGAIILATFDLRRAIEMSNRTFFQFIAIHMIDNPPKGG